MRSEHMVPPWQKYPAIPLGSLAWRMGHGEEYWIAFVNWFAGQRPDAHREYMSSGILSRKAGRASMLARASPRDISPRGGGSPSDAASLVYDKARYHSQTFLF